MSLDNILLIPGLDRPNPNNLFRDGQVGGWLDPYDLTKMWVDNAGTTPMTASDLGVGVGRIQSKGGPVITFEQATSGDRPVWGRHPVSGVRSLQTFTEDFENVAWNKSNSSVVGKFLFDNATSNQHYINNSTGLANATGQTEVFTVWGKPGTFSWMALFIDGVSAWFNLSSGTLGTVQSGLAASIALDADGFYRCRITRTRANALTTARIYVADADNSLIYLGDGTGSIELQKSQLELNSGTTYQKVTNRFDITEVGQPDLYYFSCNGVNQSWSSNATVDFSGTDKVTVWAGMRKLSDAARAGFLELGFNVPNNFLLFTPDSSAANARFYSAGSSVSFATSTGIASPITLAIVGEGNVANDICRITTNGVTVSSSTDQGSGNYRNDRLHIGRRNGTSNPFNGYIYSLIIAGDNYDTRTVQQFSDWLLKPRRLITA